MKWRGGGFQINGTKDIGKKNNRKEVFKVTEGPLKKRKGCREGGVKETDSELYRQTTEKKTFNLIE